MKSPTPLSREALWSAVRPRTALAANSVSLGERNLEGKSACIPKRREDAAHSKAPQNISREALWSAVRPRTALAASPQSKIIHHPNPVDLERPHRLHKGRGRVALKPPCRTPPILARNSRDPVVHRVLMHVVQSGQPRLFECQSGVPELIHDRSPLSPIDCVHLNANLTVKVPQKARKGQVFISLLKRNNGMVVIGHHRPGLNSQTVVTGQAQNSVTNRFAFCVRGKNRGLAQRSGGDHVSRLGAERMRGCMGPRLIHGEKTYRSEACRSKQNPSHSPEKRREDAAHSKAPQNISREALLSAVRPRTALAAESASPAEQNLEGKSACIPKRRGDAAHSKAPQNISREALLSAVRPRTALAAESASPAEQNLEGKSACRLKRREDAAHSKAPQNISREALLSAVRPRTALAADSASPAEQNLEGKSACRLKRREDAAHSKASQKI